MLQRKYLSKLVSIVNPFEGIYTLEFESLSGRFKYNPGQFLHLAVESDYDGAGQWPESRCFSMQSNPNEEILRITYAVKGHFTRQMENLLKIGSEVWLKLPYGDLFSQPHNKINTVFIAGGTGITPFLSLFTHDSFQDYINPKIYLGFRSESYNIYKEQLKQASLCNVKLFYENVNGILDINYILAENSVNSYYFISGPPVMINSFKNYLHINRIQASQILTDDWE